MFDIDSIQDLLTAEIEIRNPLTGKPVGGHITLIGPEHPRRRELDFRQARRVRKVLMDGAAQDDDSEEARAAEWIAHLADCTEGWRGIARDGAALPFSRAAAIELYTRVGWLREQVGREMQRRELFIGSSAPVSSTGPSANSD